MFACARTDVRVFLCLGGRGSRAYVPASTCVRVGFMCAGALVRVLISAGVFGWIESPSQVRVCICVLILRELEMR